jgi:predicted HicB family RNase H-like nuclease
MNVLQYKNYCASVYFSTGDEVYHGKITGIEDLISFEGLSVEELKTAFEKAVDDYQEFCLAIGKVAEHS